MEITKDSAKICALITGTMLVAVTFAFIVSLCKYGIDWHKVKVLISQGAQICDDMTYINARAELDKSSSVFIGFGVLELLLATIFTAFMILGSKLKDKETKTNESVD